MEFIRSEISDIIICRPTIHTDDRGYFFESFKQGELENFIGEKIRFNQDNESKSAYGVIRGLHYQMAPFAQAKLVRVIQGSVLDIVVDIRKSSATFGKHFSIELNDSNKLQLYIPKGFAHGYSVLSESAVFSYKVDNAYSKEAERGILYEDARLNIDWGIPKSAEIISEKDRFQPVFDNAEYFK